MEHEERLKAALADRYRIEREIGSGGMATVYLAQDLKHNRQVAVKVLDPELAQSLGAERFLREIKTAANLTHPHILPLFDSGEADGFLFYVMPFVKGESLRTLLTKERQLPVEDAVQITREIADALAYAHGEGVIHRDVKPANIMLEAGHAVLADFGVAHAVSGAKDDRITRTGTSLGTPAYMSPEQASGEHKIDGRSDLYSLGCVLYEMLTGEPPYTGPSAHAIAVKHIGQSIPSTRFLRDTVPARLDALIRRSLAKVPADRFATASGFAQALAHVDERRPRRVKVAVPLAAAVVAAGAVIALLGSPGGNTNDEGASMLTTGSPAVPVGVLPVVARDGSADTSNQAQLIQHQFASELARYRGLEVVDPLTLNSRVGAGTTGLRADELRELGRLGLRYAVHITTTPTPQSLEVTYSLTDGEDGHIVETGTFSSTDHAALMPQIRQASRRVAVALEAATGGLAKRLDVEPFLTRASNPAAIQAFLQGVEYSYRFIPGGAEYFERAVELEPDFIAPRVFLVSGSVERGDTAAAWEHLRVLQSLKPAATPFEQATIGWSEAAVQADVEGKIRHARVSLAYAPHNNFTLFDLALNLWQVGRPGEAVEPTRRAMESGWPFAMLYTLWGRLLVETGELAGLRDELEVARTFSPPDPYLEGMLEALALFEADTSAATQHGASFRSAIGASNIVTGYAELAGTYRTLARHAHERENPVVAVSLLERVVDAGVGMPILHLDLARALAESGNLQAAESRYLPVALDDLGDPEELYVAGAVAELIGRPADARRHFSRYLEVAPNGPDASRVLERLRILGPPVPP